METAATSASGPVTAVGGFELAVQRACGVGLAAVLVPSALQAPLGRVLYPRWWWLSVAPALVGTMLALVALCLTGRLRPRWAVAGTVSVSVCFALTAVATTGTVLVEGTAATGIAIIMSGFVGYALPPRWAVPSAAGLILTSLLSIALTRPSVHPELIGITGLQVALFGLGLVQRLIARRTTAAEDEATQRLRRALIADRAATSARADRRELERRLHDTVLNTLTALGRGGLTDSALLRARCAADAAFLHELRREAGNGDAGPDLLTRLRGVAADSTDTAFGAIVCGHVDATHIPEPACAALVAAVREALSNARRHSGAPAATVRVRPTGSGVEVTVLDRGRGPGPAPDAARLGIRRSIVERMADVGGVGSMSAAPGGGTEVTLRWPR